MERSRQSGRSRGLVLAEGVIKIGVFFAEGFMCVERGTKCFHFQKNGQEERVVLLRSAHLHGSVKESFSRKWSWKSGGSWLSFWEEFIYMEAWKKASFLLLWREWSWKRGGLSPEWSLVRSSIAPSSEQFQQFSTCHGRVKRDCLRWCLTGTRKSRVVSGQAALSLYISAPRPVLNFSVTPSKSEGHTIIYSMYLLLLKWVTHWWSHFRSDAVYDIYLLKLWL